MKILSKADILSAEDRPREFVEVPAWGGGFYLQALSAKQRFDCVDVADKNGVTPAVIMLIWAIQDEEGNQLFDESSAEEFSSKNGVIIGQLAEKLSQISGVGAGAVVDAKKPSG